MDDTYSNSSLVEGAIMTNIATIKNDFDLLHERQKLMINQLENDFLSAIPDKIKSLSVSEFLSKYEGDINKAFSQLSTVDLNLSLTLSQTSTFPNNFHSKDKHQAIGYPFTDVTTSLKVGKQQHLNQNGKSILKNSKRTRNEFESGHKMLANTSSSGHKKLANTYSAFIQNKENFQANIIPTFPSNNLQNSAKNTAKKNNPNYQPSQNFQASASKSSKKMWRF